VLLLEATVLDRLPFSPLGATATMLYLTAYLLLSLVKVEKSLSTDWSRVQPEDAQLAARILARAQDFAPGPVGPGAVISSEALAWRVLLQREDSKQIFTQLLAEHRPGAKLWGLAGLRVVDPAAYESEAAKLRQSTESVSFVYGCIPTPTTLGRIVAAFDTTPLVVGLLTHRIPATVWRVLEPPNTRLKLAAPAVNSPQ